MIQNPFCICILVLFSVLLMGQDCPTQAETGIAGRQSGSKEAREANRADESYFTRTNIWFEHPEKIYSTNYHQGATIPVGTEVKIMRRGRQKIVFTDVSGVKYTLHYLKKHSTITMDKLFDRYFSTEDPMSAGGKYSDFSPEEKSNIRHGVVDTGMSRDAVLMAYGYPPSHRTPNLSHSMWTYWDHRFKRVYVYFGEDNRVEYIRDRKGP